MSLDSAMCPNCGAPVNLAAWHDGAVCAHCGSQLKLKITGSSQVKLESERLDYLALDSMCNRLERNLEKLCSERDALVGSWDRELRWLQPELDDDQTQSLGCGATVALILGAIVVLALLAQGGGIMIVTLIVVAGIIGVWYLVRRERAASLASARAQIEDKYKDQVASRNSQIAETEEQLAKVRQQLDSYVKSV